MSAEDEAAAALFLARAREAFEAGDFTAAREAAGRVVESYPRAPASSVALRILAQSSYHLRAYADAVAAAERYASLFAPADRRAAAARLLAGRSRGAAGDAAGALQLLAAIPAAAPAAVRDSALALIRELVGSLDTDALEALVADLSPAGPVAAPVLAEYAVALVLGGDTAGARTYARRVLDLGPPAPERRVAEAVLAGRVEDVLGAAPVIGAVVPLSGGSYLAQSARQVEEGARLAVSAFRLRLRRPVALEVHDDLANPLAAAALVEALERAGAVALIGPLLPAGVEAAARARRGPLPILSPTARSLPPGLPGVYSLMTPDPTAARGVAEYARRSGITRVAVMYPRTAPARFEATAFMEAFRAAGGTVTLELPYDSTKTTLGDELNRVARARPDALFLPLAERDIPLVAPQVAYYGVDTLGVRVLGTAAWADEGTLRRVDPRSTNGVIAAAPLAADSSNAAYLAFVRAYEETYRRTLRSPLPAYGYDAAALVLNALRSGARTAAEVSRALEATQDFPGATGVISVRDGRIVRRHVIVRLEGGRAVPVQQSRR